MPDYNSIEAKLEAAFLQVIGEATVGTSNLFAGQDADDKALPCVVVHAERGADIAPETGTGIYRCKVTVTVMSGADKPVAGTDPEPAHETLTAKVRDAVLQDDIVAELNGAAVAELTVVDVLEAESEHGVEGRTFHDSVSVTVIAANAAI